MTQKTSKNTIKILKKPILVATDMEGCLIPEIWIGLAQKTGIKELLLTTRDIPDYDELMVRRIQILNENNITMKNLQDVIAAMKPLEGAREYLDWVRSRVALVVLSDTFYEFALPVLGELGNPCLFCHTLKVNSSGRISGYKLRKKDGKRHAVSGFQDNGFSVIAIGDSYNDTTMLGQADMGILFRAPGNVIEEYPQFRVTTKFDQLKNILSACGV